MGRIDSISIDIETFSSVDLVKSGVYRYAESPDFRILLFGYSVNDSEKANVVDLENGEELPRDVVDALLDRHVTKWAFNANFERVCLSRYFRDRGWLEGREGPFMDGWRCSMVHCACFGFPMNLADAGAALGLEKQKLTEGKDLIRFFCKPVSPSLLNSQSNRNRPFTDPEKWKRFVDYNERDVEAEKAIHLKLCAYAQSRPPWDEYRTDQVINDRGIRVDLNLVSAALHLDELSRKELTEELARLTALSNPNSVSQVRQWLEEHGKVVGSLGKKQVAALLKEADPEIRDVLLLRLQLAKTSVKKYEAMMNAVCADGRIRGMFQFYGASRSGRWAGRGVQLQNLPQNHLPDLDQARKLVLAEDYESLKMLYGSVPDVLSELIRTAFVPDPGKKFIVCDFSAIEARVIAWLAGETWRKDVFSSGGDIYCASASQMFHVPVEKNGVNGHLRQKGKIAELALGYGGGVGALKAMGALEMGVPEKELQPLVNAWRTANPNICQLWWNVDWAVKTSIREKKQVGFGWLNFKYDAGSMFIRLPSGRSLAYVNPRMEENSLGSESVTYLGINTAKKWDRIESYGPKFVENIIQGIARDLLCEAMQRLEMDGFRIVAHVHDEVIIEAEEQQTVEEVSRIMGECPDWAKGLLLRADGYECEYYRKD